MASCRNDRVVITNVYYIQNDLDQLVALTFSKMVPWDTCATGSFFQVMYDSVCPEIPPHKAIRLHPIQREYKTIASHSIDPGHFLGGFTKLIVHSDTIVWESKYAKYGHMFSSDSIWSIYNYEDWQTVQADDVLNTFYSTFHITQENIERSAL